MNERVTGNLVDELEHDRPQACEREEGERE